MTFQKEKKEFLRKKDKSIKGKIDNKIKKLVDKINSLDNFFTTSSCSGRILLLMRHSSGRKDKSKWIFSTHNKTSFKEIKNNIDRFPKEDVWFKMEPTIMHVACKNIETAKNFLNLTRDTGFRRSGMISIGKNKVFLELISTENINTIISKNKKLLINDDYFKVLIKEGNNKLEKTWKKINKLEKELDKIS